MEQPTTFTALPPVQRLLRLLGQYRREIRYVFLYAVVAGLINLSLPLGIQAIISQIAGGAINASWMVLVLIVVVGALLIGLLRLMQLSLMEYMQRRIFTDSAVEFAVRIPRLNLEVLRKRALARTGQPIFRYPDIAKRVAEIID
jgi:ABC-type bacteriocin/lantibiotic exporter with double-glycine peptidase domain